MLFLDVLKASLDFFIEMQIKDQSLISRSQNNLPIIKTADNDGEPRPIASQSPERKVSKSLNNLVLKTPEADNGGYQEVEDRVISATQ